MAAGYGQGLWQEGTQMLGNTSAVPMLPVRDLPAAQKFYEEKLGLKRLHVEPDVVATYQSGDSTLNVYRSEFAGTNQGTAALWEVENFEETVKQLKGKGVTFEHYDGMPGVTREGDVHRAGPLKIAWLKDPSGNILSVQNKLAA
jgi:catechol 2,3-dioxygenase-like lactoylglutathione lyase family enzyme